MEIDVDLRRLPELVLMRSESAWDCSADVADHPRRGQRQHGQARAGPDVRVIGWRDELQALSRVCRRQEIALGEGPARCAVFPTGPRVTSSKGRDSPAQWLVVPRGPQRQAASGWSGQPGGAAHVQLLRGVVGCGHRLQDDYAEGVVRQSSSQRDPRGPAPTMHTSAATFVRAGTVRASMNMARIADETLRGASASVKLESEEAGYFAVQKCAGDDSIPSERGPALIASVRSPRSLSLRLIEWFRTSHSPRPRTRSTQDQQVVCESVEHPPLQPASAR